MSLGGIEAAGGSQPSRPKGGPTYLPRIAKGAMINLSGTACRTVLAYAYTVFLARMLPVHDLGEYFLILSVVNILGLASVVGLDLGVVRYVALYAGEGRFRLARRTLGAAMLVAVPAGIIIAAGVFILAPSLGGRLLGNDPAAVTALRLFALYIPFWAAAKLFNATTQGLHWMRYQVLSRDIGEQFSRFLFSAIALVVGAGLTGVIWANVAALALATLLSMLFALKVLPRGGLAAAGGFSGRVRARLFRYSTPLAFSNVLGMVLVWVDMLLLGYLKTSSNVGYYGAALRVGVISSALFLAFATVFTPVISDLYNQRQAAQLGSLFKTVTRWVFICTLPLVLLQVLFANPIMSLFGGAFTAGSVALMILALSQLINAAAGPAGHMVMMSGRSKLELLNISISLIFDIVVCFLLIPRLGITGAALANVAGTALINLMRAAEVWLLMRTHAYDLSLLKPLLAGIAGAGAALAAERWLTGAAGTARVAMLAIIMVAVYLVVLGALGLTAQDRTVLGLVKKRLTLTGEGQAQ